MEHGDTHRWLLFAVLGELPSEVISLILYDNCNILLGNILDII